MIHKHDRRDGNRIISDGYHFKNSTTLTEKENQPQMKGTKEEVELSKALLAQKENDLLREKIQACQAPNPLPPETINNSSVSNYFKFCTVFTYDEFNKLHIVQTTR